MNKITISIELQDEFLREILCTAVWYGSGYWAQYQNVVTHEGEHYNQIASLNVLQFGDDEDEQSNHYIDLVKIARGVERLIGREFNTEESHGIPHVSYSATMLQAAVTNDSGEVDAELADIVLQLACFGHVIYG